MVYINSWQDYQDAAEDLYQKSPFKTRYCVKWKSSEGKLVLKITDDVSCIKFKTYSSIFLNRFEALNFSLMEKMQNRVVPPTPPQPAEPIASTAARNSPVPTANVGTTLASSGTTSGGVKKKKTKKKKPGS
ncbi:signal recognition particle, SRP9/SRP14 subunit [Lentinula raphanica]|uniref:Signal recognition particle, SRP9/SRP14 subunit n=1 Tax=Lentinula raphanica TaxID=153919 RepID=A0AA38P9G4_9AGAR|nr:signal recognition particle, SRP9/SRP14 subunit [Lentinula raphanica]KAJ3776823.1 signal recognition particle, SRP9/SRP14 subunit [Lentinula raphanica]KAJ3838616.1 signal recognition particle, SRP9/SRP14 subunit [Lentinula raphanica]KAJ3974750.1 signal recognition particle, SRP9/SRP14 subunit [Lentinula raphanica]